MSIYLSSALRLTAKALLIVGGLALAAASPTQSFAQSSGGKSSYPEAELMKRGELEDLIYGNPNAKITIIEYASMTCPHCARFHTDVFPKLRKKYIDTGKVRLIYREFPLDSLAAAASMLARCLTSEEKAKKLIDVLMYKQPSWAFVRSNPLPPLFKIAKQAGFTQKTFDKCVNNRKLLTQLSKQRARASKQFGVNSTPFFFINGKRLDNGSFSAFEKAIEVAGKG